MISRTGYTGERGYEIFVRGQDAGMVWDRILDEGKSMGIIPVCFSVLDMLRVESYLLFYPYDNSQMYPFANEQPGDSLWELGLDFTVSPGKTGFRRCRGTCAPQGQGALQDLGLLVDADGPTDLGDEVWADGKKVGVITCPSYSKLTKRSMAICRIEVPYAKQGTPVEVRGKTVQAKRSPTRSPSTIRKRRSARPSAKETTMLVQGIKSRPVYPGITLDTEARRHLFALEGEGALALLEQKAALTPDVLSRTEILYVAGSSAGRGHDVALAGLGADMVFQAPTTQTFLVRLKGSLVQARMGTRFYISGTEGFIGQAMQIALDLGIDFNSIPTEHRGSEVRRVQMRALQGDH